MRPETATQQDVEGAISTPDFVLPAAARLHQFWNPC